MEKLRTVISKTTPLEQGVLWLKPFDDGFKLYNLGDDGQWKPLLFDKGSTIIDTSTLENLYDMEVGKIYRIEDKIFIPLSKENGTFLKTYLITPYGVFIDIMQKGQVPVVSPLIKPEFGQIYHGTSDKEFNISPNEYHVWSEVDTLFIGFIGEKPNVMNEYMFEFISGATPTMLTLDTNVQFPDGCEIEANKKYQVSIVNGIGLIVGVDYE